MSNEQLETIKETLQSAHHLLCDEYQALEYGGLKEVYQDVIDDLEAAIALFD